MPILPFYRIRLGLPLVAALALSPNAMALVLNAPNSGTFTMNLDAVALAPYAGGYYLSTYWDAVAADPTDPANSGGALVGQIATAEIPALNQSFTITAIGGDIAGQAAQRFQQATSADFHIDTENLAGGTTGQVGLAGVQGFFAPNYPPNGAGLVNGDFAVRFDAARQNHGGSGWYLDNNIYFTMAVYDLSNLSISWIDADNWQFSGELAMSPENAGMLMGSALTDVGDFCLGTGSFAGCGQVSAVPLPGAIWLFGTGLAVLGGKGRRMTIFGSEASHV
ncbi:hypothetical protein HC024_11575 [Methylococcaceae bacterium WWC4]|nr:hypothetical protein [Methylococcaceae bacterium WWC4]